MRLPTLSAALLASACTGSATDPTRSTSMEITGPSVQVLAWDYNDVPQAGVEVVVNAADGSLHWHGRTGPDGWVTAPLPEQGTVSMLTERIVGDAEVTRSRWVRTVTGLMDGGVWRERTPTDELTLPVPDPMQITVDLAAGCTLPPGTVEVSVEISCQARRTLDLDVATVDVDFRCYGDRDSYDVHAYAVDEDDFRIGAGVVLDQVWEEGGSTNHAVCPDRTDLLETILILEDLPTSSTGSWSSLSGYRNGFFGGSDALSSSGGGERLVAALRLAPDVFDSFGWSLSADLSAAMGLSRASIEMRESGLSVLPKFLTRSVYDKAHFDGAPRLQFSNLERPDLTWELTEGELGSIVQLSAWWSDDDAAESTYWSAYAPVAQEGRVQFPELPEALAAFRPTLGAQVSRVAGEHFGVDDITDMSTYLSHTGWQDWFRAQADQDF
ncbi:MAG: hypothetical protein KTR31_11830 [Myxococcales bacterium]|nr:hypothetical protein [Myxococcales bacterium]